MSEPRISEATTSAISSPAFPDGPSLWDALGGRPDDECGQEAAPALPSQQPDERRLVRNAQASALSRALDEPESSSASTANTLGTQTGDISTPSSIASSLSADLQWFISNRLREEMDLSGSPEYELAWNEVDMLLGPPICRLRASARQTSDSEYGDALSGWRSPCAEDGDKGQNSKDSSGALHLQSQATLAGWATPDSSHHGAMTPEKVLDRINAYRNGDTKKATNLDDLAVLAGWPTPVASSQQESPESKVARGMSPGLNLEYAARLAGWSTPTVQDAENNAGPSQFDRNSHPLNVQATLAGWITPRSTDIGREWIPENNQRPGGGMSALEDQVLLANPPAGWATPAATTWGDTPESHLERKRKANEAGSSMGVVVTNLDAQAQLAGWTTPQASEPSSAARPSREETGRTTEYLGRQVLDLGTNGSSSTAETTSGEESRGVLNPAFSGWLMGFPWIWTYCGLLARRSLERRKSKGESGSYEALETPSIPTSPPGSSGSQCDGSTEDDDETD